MIVTTSTMNSNGVHDGNSGIIFGSVEGSVVSSGGIKPRRTVLPSPTMGTNNTSFNLQEKLFYQETLTKTVMAHHSFSQETLTKTYLRIFDRSRNLDKNAFMSYS